MQSYDSSINPPQSVGFVDFLLGRATLWKTFWLGLIAGTLFLSGLFWFTGTFFLDASVPKEFQQVGFVLTILLLLTYLWAFIMLIASWRSAGSYPCFFIRLLTRGFIVFAFIALLCLLAFFVHLSLLS